MKESTHKVKQKIVIMFWLVFSTICLSSILADTNQSQADPNQNTPKKPHPITFKDNDKFKTAGSPHVSKDGKWVAYTTASDGEYGVAHLAIVPGAGGPAKILTKKLDRGVSEIKFSDDGDGISSYCPSANDARFCKEK